MGLVSIAPPAVLARHVAQIWDCDIGPLPWRYERILPVPGASLIINLGEDETRSYRDDGTLALTRMSACVLGGPRSESGVIDTAEQSFVMGIVFKPGGAGPLSAERLDRLGNRDVDLDDLVGADARRLRERLLHAGDAQTRIRVLASWLVARVADAPHPIVAHALAAFDADPTVARVGDLVADTGYSARRFGDLFGAHVGMSPKRYCRVQRFRAVVARVHRRAQVEWSRVAADCGFYDQSHLVHEFRAFAGMTPAAYVALKGEHANHVPIDTPHPPL